MKQLLEKAIPDYAKHAALFDSLGPMGYAIALNVRNVTPELYYSTFPARWIERYTKQSFMMADPVIDYMYRNAGAVRWSEIKHSRGPSKTEQFLQVSREEGLSFGAAVVRRNATEPSVKSLISVCRSDRELTGDEIGQLEESFDLLLRKIDLQRTLSRRQREVLELMARGATRQDCAGILAVSPDTIKRDVELARKFLGARNVVEAVALATVRKLIAPAEKQQW